MTDGLTIVLSYTGREIRSIKAQAQDLLDQANETARQIEETRKRVKGLAAAAGVKLIDSERAPSPKMASGRSEADTWPALAAKAASVLDDGGAPRIDELLDPRRAELIDEMHGGSFDGSVHLDGYDIAAAVLAGVAGAFTDLLVVRIPTGGIWNGEWQTGSRLTLGLRSGAMDSDNWLSGMAKVPFDRVNDTGIAGMGPRSHRVQTFGHDPLLGWAAGTLDIMRGTLTGVDTQSVMHVVDVGNPTPNLLTALGLQAGHLLSDVFTHMGLPLPGWTALLTVPFGAIGPNDRTVGEMARWMYLRGYGTWHLATMATSVAVTEAVVRGYYALRQLLDDEYEYQVSLERAVSDARRPGHEPRYRSLSLLAHSVATAGNLGKFALAGANPLAINVAQWAMLGRRVVQRINTRPISGGPLGQHRANAAVIETGWARLRMEDGPHLAV